MEGEILDKHHHVVRDVADHSYFSISLDSSVADTISKFLHFKPDPGKTTVYYVYAVNNEGQLTGVMSLRDLLNSRGDINVSRVMKRSVISLKEDEDIEVALDKMSDLPYIALPVVNDENKLVGIVRSEEMLDVLEEEASEDILKSAGMFFSDVEVSRSHAVLESSAFGVLKIRLPWLMFGLAGGLMAGVVIEGYEEILGTVIALAFFIPVIMHMGGNVGSQASTIFIRGLAVGHINNENFIRLLLSEILIGLFIGALTGLLAAGTAYMWQGSVELSYVVFFTIVSVCFLASILGYIIPWIIGVLGFDPAAVSTPMITTIKDVTSLMIYFGFAMLFLQGF